VMSAGVVPKGLHPLAIEVMREVGIDISHQQSKHTRQCLGVPVGYVITVCDNARETLSGLSRCLHLPALGTR
jgi:arsenate reductase